MRRARSGAASALSGEASIGRMAGIKARLSYKRNRRRSETLGASANPDNPQHWAALFPRGRPFYEERIRGARRGTVTNLSEGFCRAAAREPHARTHLDFLKSSDARYAMCLCAFGASTQSLICA